MSDLKRLAKLRQYREGMDIGKYLTTELRQNWLAIEDALRRAGIIEPTPPQPPPPVDTTTIGKVVFSASVQGAFSAGVIPLTSSNSVISDGGNIISNNYYPIVAGKYLINFGHTWTCPINVATYSSSVTAFLSGGGALGSSSGSIVGLFNVASSITNHPKNSIIADLSPTSGINFSMSQSSGASSSNFNCYIVKIANL